MTTETAQIKFFQDYNNHTDMVKYLMVNLANKRKKLNNVQKVELSTRAMNHDLSKRNDYNEFASYMNMTIELENVPYGTDKHKAIMTKYNDAIQLHYKNNDHHPEHFPNGVDDMNPNQLIEMVCDWCGAMMGRNPSIKDEEILNGVNYNKQRFKINDQICEYIDSIVEDILSFR